MYIITNKKFIINSLKRKSLGPDTFNNVLDLLYADCHYSGTRCSKCFLKKEKHCEVNQVEKAKKFLSKNGYNVIEKKLFKINMLDDNSFIRTKFILKRINIGLADTILSSMRFLRGVEDDSTVVLFRKEGLTEVSVSFGSKKVIVPKEYIERISSCFEVFNTLIQEEFEI